MQHNRAPDSAGKLKLGLDKLKREEPQEVPEPPQAAEEADQIFIKMKEAGLILNAVEMPDRLCKDALVQKAMKVQANIAENPKNPHQIDL
ncbi:hypothetical protein ACFX13_035311 [Malus domestica]